MIAPVRSTPYSTALPASQTAPVAEFRCLFTTDVRRKQKRWQDGYLKFHTFNNRVMVTDQARNHIGDTYWKNSNELHEGDELSLDKGVLVEVAEPMGITQTDLAPLFGRKTKEPEKQAPARPTPSAPPRPFHRPSAVAPSNTPRAGTHLRHKSLNTLLGTPKGPVGKAQPMRSPYEARKEKENDRAEEPPPKRQKVAQRPDAWRTSSPIQAEDSLPANRTPIQARTADSRSNHIPQTRMPPVSRAITISSGSDGTPAFLSDMTLPSTPAKEREARARLLAPPVTSAPKTASTTLHQPPCSGTPQPPRTKIQLPKPKPVETPKRPAPNSSPPVSAANRITNVDFAVQPLQEPPKAPSPRPSAPQNPKAKSLRLSSGVRRGTLLCQSLSKPAPRAGSESRRSSSTTSRTASKEASPAISLSDARKGPAGPRASPPVQIKGTSLVSRTSPPARRSRADTHDPGPVDDAFDDPEVMHGLMDQQLLVPSSPSSPGDPLSPPHNAPTKSAAPKTALAQRSKALKTVADELADHTEAPILPKVFVSEPVSKKAQRKKSASEKPRPNLTVSPPHTSVFKPPVPPSRSVSPTRTDISAPTSRTSSKSPTKPLSAGGFRKKPLKRAAKEATAVKPAEFPNVTVPIPPDPLTNSKTGPLMGTTELAANLSKPKKRTRNVDSIEDAAEATKKASSRKVRRVRSENDAPIPSTAEDWEKRNLPRSSSTLTEPEPKPKKKKESALAALVKKTDPRKKLQRTKSLNIDIDANAHVEPDLPSPVVDLDVGPWSTEAADLFDWRPPNREGAWWS